MFKLPKPTFLIIIFKVYLARQPTHIFSLEALRKPNPECDVCGIIRAKIEADLDKTKLGDIIVKYLQERLKYGDEICIMTEQLLYDIEETDNAEKTLRELNILSGSTLTVIDEEDDDEEGGARVNLLLDIIERYVKRSFHSKKFILITNYFFRKCSEDDITPFVLPGDINIKRKIKSSGSGQETNGAEYEQIINEQHEKNSGQKRKRNDENETEESSTKKIRNNVDAYTVLLDEDDGVIIID